MSDGHFTEVILKLNTTTIILPNVCEYLVWKCASRVELLA